MVEAQVQVPPDSTGKKIRTIELSIAQADGTFATVETQVVAIVDVDGNAIRFDDISRLLQELIEEVRELKMLTAAQS